MMFDVVGSYLVKGRVVVEPVEVWFFGKTAKGIRG